MLAEDQYLGSETRKRPGEGIAGILLVLVFLVLLLGLQLPVAWFSA